METLGKIPHQALRWPYTVNAAYTQPCMYAILYEVFEVRARDLVNPAST